MLGSQFPTTIESELMVMSVRTREYDYVCDSCNASFSLSELRPSAVRCPDCFKVDAYSLDEYYDGYDESEYDEDIDYDDYDYTFQFEDYEDSEY